MFTLLTDIDCKDVVNTTNQGVIIGFKELCPHCKNMEKVLGKFSKTHPGVMLYSLNIELSAEAFKELGGERPPTVFIIKNGTVVSQKAGLMNPKEMKAFYQKS